MKYVGGYDSSDAIKERLETFADDDDYFMKGYMLTFEAPPLNPGTTVTWSVTRGGVSRGAFYPTGAWIDYFSSLPSVPTSQVVHWRSDYTANENLSQTYTIHCTYTGTDGSEHTITRAIKSRELNPDDATIRDNFNTDTNMVQRALIQVFGLDKGRLDSWDVGKYQRNGGVPPYYHSTTGGGGAGRNWSKVADEVWNFDRFVVGTFSGTSYNLKARQIAELWNQFQLILAAGNIGSVRLADVNVGTAISGAGLNPPSGFPGNAATIVSGVCKMEGGSTNPPHSYTKHVPLAVNSVRVGEAAVGSGSSLHSYTDWGIGFAALQPYNAGGQNLYKPNDNLFRCAQFFQSILSGPYIPPSATGAKAKVWYACYGYNQGPVSIPQSSSPQALRAAGIAGAQYADGVFSYMGITAPNLNTE